MTIAYYPAVLDYCFLYTIDHFIRHLLCRCGLNKWIGQQLMLLQVIWLFLQDREGGRGGGGRTLD
jgi:hypothetical protein